MDHQRLVNILSGRSRGIAPSAVRAGLSVAERSYAAAMRVRRWAYRNGVLRSRPAGVPVISVGNVTTGGTGKTPMVAWVVRRLLEMRRRPAVLIRGYEATGGKSDEAELLAGLLNQPAAGGWQVPVVVNPDRIAGARQAVAAGADAAVLDDGFQHLRIRRDLDIVLIDATNPFGFGHVLPRGLLREPLSALRAADAVVITRADMVEPAELDSLRNRLHGLAGRATLHAAVHRPAGLVGRDGQTRPLGELAGRKVLAFCGLGNPRQFFQTAEKLGAILAGTRAFDDHVAYSQSLLADLNAQAPRCGAELLLTTQKDAIKLPADWAAVPVYALAVELEVTDGREELLARIEGALEQE